MKPEIQDHASTVPQASPGSENGRAALLERVCAELENLTLTTRTWQLLSDLRGYLVRPEHTDD